MAEQNPSAKRDAYQHAGEGDMTIHSGSGDMNYFQQPINVVNHYHGRTPTPIAEKPGSGNSIPRARKRKGMWQAATENGRWYFLLSIISVGTLAFVPFIHAATVLRRRICYIYSIVFGVVGGATFIIIQIRSATSDSESGLWSSLFSLFVISLISSACILQSRLRNDVYAEALNKASKTKQ